MLVISYTLITLNGVWGFYILIYSEYRTIDAVCYDIDYVLGKFFICFSLKNMGNVLKLVKSTKSHVTLPK